MALYKGWPLLKSGDCKAYIPLRRKTIYVGPRMAQTPNTTISRWVSKNAKICVTPNANAKFCVITIGVGVMREEIVIGK